MGKQRSAKRVLLATLAINIAIILTNLMTEELIIDEDSNQTWKDGYYYPVEPQDSVDLDDGFLHFNLFQFY